VKLGKIVLTGAALMAVALGGWIARPLPAGLLDPPAAASVTLLDRFGQPLRATRAEDGADRRWMPLAALDADVLRTFVALEDHRFMRHHGVDVAAALRAARDGWRAQRVVSGASTITMQLARLLVPIPRTGPGKVRQALWALRLEAHLTKNEILEQYLNRIPLGQGTVGVAAAADFYFDATARDLSLGQAALLAALATAPSRDNPFVDRARAARRRAGALGRLRVRGLITVRDSALAAAGPVLHVRPAVFDAPHFTTRVLGAWTRDSSTDRSVHPSSRRSVVSTSLDLALQREVESEVRHTVATLADRGARDAAAVILANASGQVLAWVGSPDFWAEPAGQVDLVTSPRQPGSAMKPFLYGLAFDHGYSPASVLPDVARSYATPGGVYAPRNYDRRFHGPVRAREALASSHNVPAVELTSRLGAGALLGVLHRAGFTSLARPAEHYGLGLALGNGDVTLLELANAYRSLANGGVRTPWTWQAFSSAHVLTFSRQEHVRTGPRENVRVMSPVAAALVIDILADPVARISGFGPETPFVFPFPAAVKTGTSRNFTDNWAVAVTGGFTVAVWVGDASGRPMEQVSGITGAGPLLQRAVLRTAARYPAGVLPTPAEAGARRINVCALSGGLAHPGCPGVPEWVPADAPLEPCTWHRDGVTVLPEAYAEWLGEATGAAATTGAFAGAHVLTSPRPHVLTSSSDGSPVRIISPQSGDRYSVPAGTDRRYATIALRAVTREPAVRLRWFVDGAPVTSARWRLTAGAHLIRAVADDGSSDEVHIVVE
jgi:penicillin-binding protein 1C